MSDYPALQDKDRYQHVYLVDVFGNPFKSIPDSLITSDGPDGRAPRLRVDPGQTGFFDGRMFRNYINGVIPTVGPTVQFRFTAVVDFILWVQQMDLTQGALQMEVFTGATSTGVWTDLTPIGLNRMLSRPQPYYVPVNKLSIGGDFTGGTQVDLMQLRAAAANNNANNVGGDFSERGLPPAVFHGRFSTLAGGLTVNDAAQFLYQLYWEERP